MGDEFHSDGGEQNIAQGQNAIGKQVNTTQPVSGDNNIFSGTGNVTVNQNVLLKPRTRTILLAAALFGAGFAAWHWLAPAPSPSKSATTTAPNSPAIITDKGNVAVTYNSYNVSLDLFEKYVKELNVTDTALVSFFKIMEEQKVSRADLDSKLREIAAKYKELLKRLEIVQSEDPQVVKLKEQARQAFERGDYAKTEELLNQAEARDVQAIEELERTAQQRRISAAVSNVENAMLQEVQLRYPKAAEYWQKAAAILPEERKKERAKYLNNAGYDFHRVALYANALSIYKQSLVIRREIGDKAGEVITLNNISGIHFDQGDSIAALKYLEQSLTICHEIDDKAGAGITLNNIGQIYKGRGDYTTALKYIEQSLTISRELGDKAGVGTALNNIGLIYQARNDYATALNYLEQSLVIFREIKDKAHEGGTLNNIGQIYKAQNDYTTTLKYLEQSLIICREIGDKKQEGITLNNLATTAYAEGDSATALKYLEQSLRISQEIGNKTVEGTTLNNIAEIHRTQGKYDNAIPLYEKSLSIHREIGDKEGEAVTSWNIGLIYKDQGDLAKAEPYISRAVQLAEEIGHPKLEEWREDLQRVRAKLRERQ